jgi:hypothetical protein
MPWAIVKIAVMLEAIARLAEWLGVPDMVRSTFAQGHHMVERQAS